MTEKLGILIIFKQLPQYLHRYLKYLSFIRDGLALLFPYEII